jgi:hypothetical protein
MKGRNFKSFRLQASAMSPLIKPSTMNVTDLIGKNDCALLSRQQKFHQQSDKQGSSTKRYGNCCCSAAVQLGHNTSEQAPTENHGIGPLPTDCKSGRSGSA